MDIKKAGISIAALYAATFAARAILQPLKHFSPAEFGVWYPLIHPETLAKLDEFRRLLGFPVAVSWVEGAIGRLDGSETSQHFPSPLIRAIDVFPVWPNGGTPQELQRAYEIAKQVGFTGIGVYPDTTPRPMMHLDTRTNRAPGNPATWARFKLAGGGYDDKSINEAFV